MCREQPSVRLWEKNVNLKPVVTLHRNAGVPLWGLRPASLSYYPCLQHDECMRASGKDRPCKEQGTIPDHPDSGSSRI